MLLALATTAQNFHFAARVGIANYQGDLQAKNITFKQAKFLELTGRPIRYFGTFYRPYLFHAFFPEG